MTSKNYYVLNYTDLDGRRKQKFFYGKTKRIAKDKADKFLMELDKPEKEKPVSFREWSEKWFSLYPEHSHLTDATLQGYDLSLKHLCGYFGSMPIQSIRPTDVRQFFAEFKKPDGSEYSASMLRKVRNTFSAVMDAACDNGLIYHNPVRSYRVKSTRKSAAKRAYSFTHAAVFSEYAKKHPDGLGAYILLHTGLRISEMMGIIPETDFDFKEGVLTLHQTITDAAGYPQVNHKGKTATALRSILLDPDALDYLGGRPYPPGFLFKPASNRSRRDYMGMRAWTRGPWKRFIKDFKKDNPDIPALMPGELRHTWFTLMREVNFDLRVVDLQGGHALHGLTDSNYSHYSVAWLKKNTIFPDYQRKKVQ